MKLSQAKRGMYFILTGTNPLVLAALGDNTFIMAISGEMMTKAKPPIDLDLPLCSKRDYMRVVKTVDHKESYESITLELAIEHDVEQMV